MSKIHALKTAYSLLLLMGLSLSIAAQGDRSIPYKSQEVSEIDGIPVLIKHLPDWESKVASAVLTDNGAKLVEILGPRPIIDLIDFSGGTEAVTAPYDAAKLLIVEYSTPQASLDGDAKFNEHLAGNIDRTTVYRRIGNYNAFVFDSPDTSAANALLDQVKYEKQVQWLGKNPFLITAERAFVLTTSDIFLSTLFVILIGIGVAIFGGLISGYVFYHFRDGRRDGMNAFSDAGGMTRLNLDGLSSDE